jgi:hypothetical protein
MFMYCINTCCNTVMAGFYTHLRCRTELFTQVFLSWGKRQCGLTTWIMVQIWSTIDGCFYKLVRAKMVVIGYILLWVFISKLLFGVIEGQNWYLWWRCTNLLASKLAKRLLINYWRYEGMITLKIGVSRLLTYMMEPWPINYCIISYAILLTHFEGHLWYKL